MIGEGRDSGLGRSQHDRGVSELQKTRLSNVNPAPYNAAVSAVEAEESLGKYTEDFGGYDLNDQKSRNSRLGYETRANENLE